MLYCFLKATSLLWSIIFNSVRSRFFLLSALHTVCSYGTGDNYSRRMYVPCVYRQSRHYAFWQKIIFYISTLILVGAENVLDSGSILII